MGMKYIASYVGMKYEIHRVVQGICWGGNTAQLCTKIIMNHYLIRILINQRRFNGKEGLCRGSSGEVTFFSSCFCWGGLGVGLISGIEKKHQKHESCAQKNS